MIGIISHGSLALVGPDDGDHLAFADWLADNVGDEALFWGDALVVEPRYLDGIVGELEADGFQVVQGAV